MMVVVVNCVNTKNMIDYHFFDNIVLKSLFLTSEMIIFVEI